MASPMVFKAGQRYHDMEPTWPVQTLPLEASSSGVISPFSIFSRYSRYSSSLRFPSGVGVCPELDELEPEGRLGRFSMGVSGLSGVSGLGLAGITVPLGV